MWFPIYNILLILAFPFILLILASKARCRPGLPQRCGLVPETFPFDGKRRLPDASPVIWVHAVSLGEVVAVVPLLQQIHKTYPDYHIVVSTITETGREAVLGRLAGIAEHCYAPLDVPWVVNRVVDRIRPRTFLFVETELWPNLLRVLRQRNIPTMLVNGRLSSNSFRGYRLIRFFWKDVLQQVSRFCMQSDRDAARIMELGAPPDRVWTLGNIKFDRSTPEDDKERAQALREFLGDALAHPLIVAGSTHPGEEEILLRCYRELQVEFPVLGLLLAPRHIERAEELERTILSMGLFVARRSVGTGSVGMQEHRSSRGVLILDTRGELVTAYRYATLAFVGGTLVSVGGHNLLEPAFWGKPVFFGPHIDHVTDSALLLLRAGGGVQVSGLEELVREMKDCLRHPTMAVRKGQAAKQVVEDNRGALTKTLDILEPLLTSDHDPTGNRFSTSGAQFHAVAKKGRPLFPLQQSPLIRPILKCLSLPYGLVAWGRRTLYERGWVSTQHLPCPVVSIGNLSVGGTGKTPLVMYLVRCLEIKGLRVGVLSRGYGRIQKDPFTLVSDGEQILTGPDEAGDEPFLIAKHCPRAVVAVGAARYQLGKWVLERHPVDCFILDDGFQHYAIHRDENILVVDGSDPDGLKELLPAGRLREPVSASTRATLLAITRVTSDINWRHAAAPVLARLPFHCRVLKIRFTVESMVEVSSGEQVALHSVKGKSGVLVSGIGNPGSFRRTVQDLGITILDEIVFPDHHVYSPRDLAGILEKAMKVSADFVFTTEKDAVKMFKRGALGRNVLAITLGVEVLEGRAELDRVIGRVVERSGETAGV